MTIYSKRHAKIGTIEFVATVSYPDDIEIHLDEREAAFPTLEEAKAWVAEQPTEFKGRESLDKIEECRWEADEPIEDEEYGHFCDASRVSNSEDQSLRIWSIGRDGVWGEW